MNAIPPVINQSRSRFRTGYVLLGGLVLVLAAVAIGVTGYFRLSSETAALRATLLGSAGGKWEKRIALRVGMFTTGLVRLGSRFFELPPEAQAGIASVRGAEVGIYRSEERVDARASRLLLIRADKAMARRGWDRVVGVMESNRLVAVYLPKKGLTPGRVKCCVAVLDGRDLVLVSVRGTLEPLLGIIEKQVSEHAGKDLLAACGAGGGGLSVSGER